MQSILCYIDFSDSTESLRKWIRYLTRKLDNPVDLLFVDDHSTNLVFKDNPTKSDIEKKLAEFRKECGSPGGNNYVREGCNCSVVSEIAETNDSLFIVVPAHKRNDVQFLSSSALVKMLRNSRIPCLAVPEKSKFTEPESLDLALNYQREQKTVSPWVVFFSKHLNTDINVYIPKTEDQRITHNFVFFKKICEKHNLNFNKVENNKSVSQNRKFALKGNKKGIYFLNLNKKQSMTELITGDKDARIIDSRSHPVFCINSRDDIYIPCT